MCVCVCVRGKTASGNDNPPAGMRGDPCTGAFLTARRGRRLTDMLARGPQKRRQTLAVVHLAARALYWGIINV